MQAWALTTFGADRFDHVKLPDPKAAERQVVIRNHAAGVNNIDLLIRRGEILSAETMPLPYILGVEGAGIVEEVGSGVSDYEIGDRVVWVGDLGVGGYAPYAAVDTACIAKIEPSVPFAVAAAAAVAFATARHAIFSYGTPAQGEWVLIHSAAGGVGTACIQVARNAGLRTIALTSSSKLHIALEQGADIAIDRQADDVVQQIMAATDAKGIALSLNSVAGSTIMQDLQVLDDFGQIISFGHLGGPPTGSASDLLLAHFGKSPGIRVSDLYTLKHKKPLKFNSILREVASDLNRGAITPKLHTVLPAAEAFEAHRLFQSGEVTGKIVLSND